MINVYFIQFILTKKCNKECYYCDLKSSNEDLEIDLDFLKYVLNILPEKLMIEVSGGEIGLIKNLDDVLSIIYGNKKVKSMNIMSNGLVRLKGYDFIDYKNVQYREHLIKEIVDKKVVKMYDSLDFIRKENWRYVVVTTQNTIKSLIINFEYFKSKNFFDDMFWFKLINEKTIKVDNIIDILICFYEKLKSINHIDSNYLENIKYINNYNRSIVSKRFFCSSNVSQPVIDFETKEIVHCSTNLMKSQRFKFNKENFDLNLKRRLFSLENCCSNCYVFEENQEKFFIKGKNGIFENRKVFL